jgi:hypothetical protein
MHQRMSQSLCGRTGRRFTPFHVRAVEATGPASVPPREMQDRRVTEPHEWFRIARDRLEVEPIGQSVTALPAARGKNRAHTRIAKRIVQIGKTILVSTRQVVTLAVERMVPDFDRKTPVRQHPDAARDRIAAGRARR